jgi:signal transduction histidine kinase
MRIRFNLQCKVLLLVAGAMTATLFCSFYLHQLITRALIEDDRYNAAVSNIVAIAGRIAAHEMFSKTNELKQDLQYVTASSPDIRQIDVYRTGVRGPELAASTALDAPRLPALDENAQDNEFGEMEHPIPDVISQETLVGGRRHWLISVGIKDPDGSGYVSALILKNPQNSFVTYQQRQHNLVLGGAIAASVLLLYLTFVFFFRRPAREIVRAMACAQAGDLNSRTVVSRDDELGEIARGFNQMIHDLSERDSEREELLTKIRCFNRDLSSQIDAATKELREANESLLQTQQRLARYERLAATGQIAASLAHEVGTPLNAISGHLQLLEERFAKDTDVQRRIGIINKQVDFIVGIVRTLLQRTHAPRPVLRPTDLNALVRELLLLVTPAVAFHSIRVHVSLTPDTPIIHADRDSMQQVFLNLVNNSIDAMPGGGQLEISTRVIPEARLAELTVRDDGEGIPPAAFEHLFEALWTTKGAGGGFGLAIAREIMKEHGGRIEPIKEQIRGAAFRLTLPLADAALFPNAPPRKEVEVLVGNA